MLKWPGHSWVLEKKSQANVSGRGTVIIGIDFDNTIAAYDDLIYEIATERALIGDEIVVSKRHIRDAIRLLPLGEIEWQRIQGMIYGPLLHRASLFEGVYQFLERCCQARYRVHIVSHKSRYAPYDRTQTDLRQAAVEWMRDKELFDTSQTGISRDSVFFASTRAAKVDRIRELGCTHFVDDLEETFLEPGFPSSVMRILFSPTDSASVVDGLYVANNWAQVTHMIFSGR